MAELNGQSQQWNRLYFDEWVAREGLDLLHGTKVDDVYTTPLKYWPRTEGYAVQIQLDGTGEQDAAYICEIPPGKQLVPQRHLYEELIYILSGRGSTSVWYDERRKNSFEWQAGSLFTIPLNARHQFFNGSGAEPARYISVTTAPIMMNLIRNDDFIFNNDAVFPERYQGESNYFSGEIDIVEFGEWDIPIPIACSNFFADIHGVEYQDMNRGINTSGMTYEFASGVLGAHTVVIPGGTFSKIHRHGPGAHVLWLRGEGYSLIWPDGGAKVKEDWGPGTLIVPPSWWWHTHSVVSKEPAEHLALKLSSKKYKIDRLSMKTMLSSRKGGNQMDYEDFPPELMEEVLQIFREECAKRGTPVLMEKALSF
jgi:mannose-6-phosphate isomerase-like protein (cupin superfamily)